MTGLIKTIGIFVIIYLVFRLFTLHIFPAILRWYLNRVKRRFYKNYQQQRNPKHEEHTRGKTKIRVDTQQKNGQSTDKIGEYVDFEEIKDSGQKGKGSKEKES